MNINFKSRKETCKILGIHFSTLYRLADNDEIETVKIGKQRMYNIDKYLNNKKIMKPARKRICYCRVSSQKQKEDLKRQIEYMKNKYPLYEIVSDIGSGLNFKRNGLNKIIDLAINGDIEVVVVTHKDRLARFGYDLIETIISKYSKGKIKVENKKEEETPLEEISKDIISIMNVYTAKINGLRKYKTQIKEELKNMEENDEKLK